MLSKDQIQSIVDELRLDSRIRGILLTGSYVYGTPSDLSDLDIRCLTTDAAQKGEKERICFGVRVELYVETVDKVLFFMRQSIEEGHGACLHFWANGRIVYDPEGLVEKLQSEALSLWKNGRPDGQPWAVRESKYQKYID